MAFDPSVIGQIGEQPDFGSAVSKGFQIKDLMNANTLDQYKLRQAKQQEQDDKTVREVTSGADLSSPAGVSKAASELTKKGLPDASMKLMKGFQDIQSGALDNQIRGLQAAQSAMDFSASMFDPLYQRATQMRTEQAPDGRGGTRPRYTDTEINAYITSQVPTFIKQIKEAPDTVLTPQFKQLALQRAASTPNITYDQLQSIENDSKTHREKIKAQLDQLNVQSTMTDRDINTQEKVRHDKAMEAKGGVQGDGLSDEGQSLYNDLVERDPSFLSRVSTKGIEERNKVINAWAKEGKTADQVIGSRASTKATNTEATVLARREASILPVEQSITKPGGFLDQAESAVNKINLSKLKAAGKFETWTKDQESDPDLASYRAAVAELRAEYSIVLSKGGQVTDAARHESEKVIPDLITPAQFKNIKQVVQRGIEASKTGVESSLDKVTNRPEKPAANEPTATGPDGKKVVYRGGQWVPLGQ